MKVVSINFLFPITYKMFWPTGLSAISNLASPTLVILLLKRMNQRDFSIITKNKIIKGFYTCFRFCKFAYLLIETNQNMDMQYWVIFYPYYIVQYRKKRQYILPCKFYLINLNLIKTS